MEILDGGIAYAASLLLAVKPDDAHPTHFFLSAEQHVVEGGLMVLFFTALVHTSKRMIKTPNVFHHKENPPLTLIEKILGFTLTVNILAQVIYKSVRGWKVLSYMLQPCHMATLLCLYCLYSKNYQRASTVFQISLHYAFFTILAIAVPDLAQLHLPFEVLNFWVQHYALVLTPLYLLFFSDRFPLSPSLSTTILAIGIGGIFHFGCQLPAGIVTGINVNYMLWPPPGVPTAFAGKNYRQLLTLGFMFLASVTGYFLPKLALLFHRPKKDKLKKQQKQK